MTLHTRLMRITPRKGAITSLDAKDGCAAPSLATAAAFLYFSMPFTSVRLKLASSSRMTSWIMSRAARSSG